MNNHRRQFLGLALGAALTTPLLSLAATRKNRKKAEPKKELVILHVTESDPKRWNLVLNSARTLQTEYGESKIDIVIITNGPGVTMLKEDADVANRIEAAMERRIVFIAGTTSMKALNLTEKNMIEGVQFVTSGTVEVVKRQRAGWAYVRP